MAELSKTNRPVLRATFFLFGIGQITLWIIAMATGVMAWYPWIQLSAGVLGLYIALVQPNLENDALIPSGYVLSLGMIALWIVGLALGVTGWETWVSFGLDVLLFLGTVYKTPEALHRPVTA